MVMKKLLIRMLREIRSQLGQFLSVTLIIAVGSALMMGMFAAIASIDRETEKYYNEQNMADLWLYFEGISEDEIGLLGTDATQIEGRYTYAERLEINGTEVSLRFHSLTDINRPLVIDGALPSAFGEILVNYKFAEANNLALGSEIELNGIRLRVSGLCMNPEYAYKQKDGGAADLTNKSLGIAYTEKETIRGIIEKSDAFIEIKTEVETKLSDAEAELTDAQKQLDDAIIEYQDGLAEADEAFLDAETQLAETLGTLTEGQAELNRQRDDFHRQISNGQSQIDSASVSIADAKQKLDAAYAEYTLARETLPEDARNQKDAEFSAQYAELERQNTELAAQQNTLYTQKSEAERTFAEKQAELDNALIKYDEAIATFETEKEDTYTKLTNAKTEIEDGQAELNEARAEFITEREDALRELDDALTSYTEVLVKTDQPDIVTAEAKTFESFAAAIPRDSQPSYVNVSGAIEPVRAVSYVFPLIFFFVAAAVAFISLSKTVDNQRMQIAIMQAIGISKSKIRAGFLSYSLLAAIFGALPFAFLGNILIPELLTRIFMKRFEMPAIEIPVYWLFAAVPLVLAMLFCGMATVIVVRRVLKEVPAQAMRPKPPKGSKKIALERFSRLWKRLSYSNKLIARNIFLNKKRVLLSSIGVIGSVMLILSGLSLRQSAMDVIEMSIASIDYDLSVTYNEPITAGLALPEEVSADKTELSESGRITLNLTEDVTLAMQIVQSGTELVHLFDCENKRIELGSDSVILPDSVAMEYGVSIGDTITVLVDEIEYVLAVTDISAQYVTKTVYMSLDSAIAAGMNTQPHTLLLFLDGMDADTAATIFERDPGIKNVSTKNGIITLSEEMLKTLNAIIALILASAAVLSVTVIYNITSINIFERTREYTTLMVLGYQKKQVSHLTIVENMILTALGCILGLPAGYVLFRYLTTLVAGSMVRLPTSLNIEMLSVTVVFSFGLTVLSNALLRPRINKIVLVEALKSVE